MYKRPKLNLVVRDDLPRFQSFIVSLPNVSDHTYSFLPPMQKVPLPYQVLSNGRIIAAQLLKLEIAWSPAEGISAGTSSINLVKRIVLDAVQSPHVSNGVSTACDPNVDPDRFAAPLMSPSVLGVYDRVMATGSGVTDSDFGNVGVQQLEEHSFSCCGDNPIIPSGGVYVYGWHNCNSGSAYAASIWPTPNQQNLGFATIFKRPVSPNYPASTTLWNPDNQNPQPYATCRLWYRVVELTPYQHIMIVQKYTNKVGLTSDESYNKLLNTGSATAGVYPNISPNPQRSETTPPNAWFGS